MVAEILLGVNMWVSLSVPLPGITYEEEVGAGNEKSSFPSSGDMKSCRCRWSKWTLMFDIGTEIDGTVVEVVVVVVADVDSVIDEFQSSSGRVGWLCAAFVSLRISCTPIFIVYERNKKAKWKEVLILNYIRACVLF